MPTCRLGPVALRPLFCATTVKEFQKENIIPNWTNKTKTFNFQVEKKQEEAQRVEWRYARAGRDQC
jgi:hypothetical protein